MTAWSMSATGRGNLTLKIQQVQPGEIADLHSVAVPKSSYHTTSDRGTLDKKQD